MSTLNVDALVGNTSANAITVRGEGSATTSLQQGLCKAWINYNTRTSTSISDSFSVASISDGGTGLTTINFTNAMANANFCQTMGMGDMGTTWTTSHAMAATNDSAKTTGQTKFHTGGQNTATASDLYENNVMIAGDLA
tara:strand:+ start:280 stop:696 length:417 start_codon:yes stop_codon:yes gene_type:complete